jgi:hypothetical protein
VSATPGVLPDAVTGRFRLASPRIALVLGAAMVVSMVAAVPLWALAGGDGFLGVALVPFGIVGAVIAWRQPWNPVGPVLLLLTLAVVACSNAADYAVMVYHRGYHLPLGRVAVFLAPGAWVWMIVLLPLPLALFPDGRLARRWRFVLWAYLVFCVFLVGSIGWTDLSGVTARQIQVGSNGDLASMGSSSSTSTSDIVILLLRRIARRVMPPAQTSL